MNRLFVQCTELETGSETAERGHKFFDHIGTEMGYGDLVIDRTGIDLFPFQKVGENRFFILKFPILNQLINQKFNQLSLVFKILLQKNKIAFE